MKMLRNVSLVAAMVLSMAAVAAAETKVTLEGVHLCCGACLKGVAAAVKDIEGAKAACDKGARTVTITAGDEKTAQKAVDALAAAGFHGKSDSDKVAIKEDAGVKGKAKRLELYGAHNCCGGCAKAIKGAAGDVDGVQAIVVKGKKSAVIVLEGEFDSVAVVKALNKAGFHVTGKKPKKDK